MRKILLPTLILGIICSTIIAVNWAVGKMACPRSELPIRQFMAERIEYSGNADTVVILLGYMPNYVAPEHLTWRNVPWAVLLPSYVLSELKSAFPLAVIALGFVGIALVMTRNRTARPQLAGCTTPMQPFDCGSVLSPITRQFIVASVFVAIFLMMLILTELPKVPLAAITLGSIALALVIMRKNRKEAEPKS